MKDDEWLALCGKNGWIAFSHDRKFHAVEVELMAVKQHGVGAFYLPGGSEPTWYKICYLIRTYPKIVEAINTTTKPFIYRIHPTLRLEQMPLP